MKLTVIHRGLIILCFRTNCRKVSAVKISLDTEKRTLRIEGIKCTLNVNNKIKAIVILDLILNIEDSLDNPEGKLI